MKKLPLLFLLLLLPWLAHAFTPLPAEQAFQFSADVQNQKPVLKWKIAPGYYLYQDRFKFDASSVASYALSNINLPKGITKQDDIFGIYQVYKKDLALTLPALDAATKDLSFTVTYQGCAESGFCYPAITKQVEINLDKTPQVAITKASASFAALPTTVQSASVASTSQPSLTEQDQVTHILSGGHVGLIFLVMLGLGLLLSFTPCVLPMLPILASIIVGQGKNLSMRRAFSLSLTYVVGMSIGYATAGIIAGLAGHYVQAFFQNPWIITIFSIIFVLLALSLFGFYELQLPAKWQGALTNLSNRQSGGTYFGVAIMGLLASLIVSPCITAPLIGVLIYIGQTGNAWLGGSALFTMGLGMGIPLLIVGTLGGRFMPKSGPWLLIVKAVFGVLLLAMAIWLLQRILPGTITLLLWALLAIITSVYMGAFSHAPTDKRGKFAKGLGLVIFVYGLLLLIGAAIGNSDPLRPLQMPKGVAVSAVINGKPAFQRVKTIVDVQQAVTQAKAQHKPVMLDFYADWCIACKQMERDVFTNPQVKTLLGNFVLLQADVTANDAADQVLEQHFSVLAPPTMLFFDRNGQEMTAQRIVGEVNAREFEKRVQNVLSLTP